MRNTLSFDADSRHDALRFYEEIRQQLAMTLQTTRKRRAACMLFLRSRQQLPSFEISACEIDFPCGGQNVRSDLLGHQKHRNQDSYNRIIGIDEMNWRSVSPGFWTWATTGTESVSCLVENDEKEGITVIAGVAATGRKSPLTIIGKGKTPMCLNAFNLSQKFRRPHHRLDGQLQT
jgi:hypothetical protein